MNALAQLNQKLEANFANLPLVNKKEDIVPGEGQLGATIMMIGEAPGFNEAVQRRPFVGRSGQLLRQTISAVGLDLKDIYISNIVKARPPENRDPSPQEIAAFKPYLDEEIEILKPKLIVTLGRFSLNKFLPDVKISTVHGRLHKVSWNDKKIFVLPMYHPAAALRGTQVKNQFVADFAKINKILLWIDDQNNFDLSSLLSSE
ncbi:uracil-DNA glycosylase [Patescibacteria group bacterium]|nr:uracil-DNA glycosylase [Patescibacteria group bacterium]